MISLECHLHCPFAKHDATWYLGQNDLEEELKQGAVVLDNRLTATHASMSSCLLDAHLVGLEHKMSYKLNLVLKPWGALLASAPPFHSHWYWSANYRKIPRTFLEAPQQDLLHQIPSWSRETAAPGSLSPWKFSETGKHGLLRGFWGPLPVAKGTQDQSPSGRRQTRLDFRPSKDPQGNRPEKPGKALSPHRRLHLKLDGMLMWHWFPRKYRLVSRETERFEILNGNV